MATSALPDCKYPWDPPSSPGRVQGPETPLAAKSCHPGSLSGPAEMGLAFGEPFSLC